MSHNVARGTCAPQERRPRRVSYDSGRTTLANWAVADQRIAQLLRTRGVIVGSVDKRDTSGHRVVATQILGGPHYEYRFVTAAGGDINDFAGLHRSVIDSFIALHARWDRTGAPGDVNGTRDETSALACRGSPSRTHSLLSRLQYRAVDRIGQGNGRRVQSWKQSCRSRERSLRLPNCSD